MRIKVEKKKDSYFVFPDNIWKKLDLCQNIFALSRCTIQSIQTFRLIVTNLNEFRRKL